MTEQTESPPVARRPRWGLRTLGFLILTIVALITASTLGHNTVGTLGSSLLGVVGATYCSIRGVREAWAGGLHGFLTGGRRPGP